MNRETKIGLLVGLAFIIVIGVLLSDHIQTSTQTRPAVLTASGEVLRTGTAAPGSENPGAQRMVPPPQITPTGPVATTDQLNLLEQKPADIQIGPADRTPVILQPVATTDAGITVGPGVPPGVLIPSGGTTLAAADHEIIHTPMPGTGGTAANDRGTPQVAQGGMPNGASAPSKQHVAVSGDSLVKLTKKYYGGWNKAREQLIVAANPSLAKGGQLVIGQKYNIPALPGQSATPAPATPGPTNPGAASPGAAVASNLPQTTPLTPAAAPTVPPAQNRPALNNPTPVANAPKAPAKTAPVYTVKNGDSLAKIASANGVTLSALRSANKDLLKGSDTLQIGMKLKLPEKQVASAN